MHELVTADQVSLDIYLNNVQAEKLKILGETRNCVETLTLRARARNFSFLPNFRQYFYNSVKARKTFSISKIFIHLFISG